jgi:TonB family protein
MTAQLDRLSRPWFRMAHVIAVVTILVVAAPGAGRTGGEVSVDANVPDVGYVKQVRDRITAKWHPRSPTRSAVIIRVEASSDGRVYSAAVERSSGSADDDVALRAVRSAAPFPTLPEEYRGRRVEFTLRLIMALPAPDGSSSGTADESDRSGAPEAKCTTRQFPTSWITACESPPLVSLHAAGPIWTTLWT